ncbi:MAG: flagellar basal body rod protein FlgC [Polyangiaceae bacterium]
MKPTTKIAGVFTAMEVAASGLSAERSRMNVVASNLANAKTTRTAEGTPYKRLDPTFRSTRVGGDSFDPILRNVSSVAMTGVREDPRPGASVYEPGHPDADAKGYVVYPNVNVVTEMVNLMTASRAYEAGVTSIETIKSMARAALKIGQ